MNIKKTLCMLALLSSAQQVLANDFDFSGAFINDNDVQLFNFTVGSGSTITIFSSSWDDGGLDPILALWDSTGAFIEEQDDGVNVGSTSSNGTSYTHGEWDSHFTQFLTAGDYIASIVQYDNFHFGANLSDGFDFDSNPNFTSLFGCTNGSFCGFDGDNRTPNWAFHILNVDSATIAPGNNQVPEPSTLVILSIGLLGLGYKAKERQQAKSVYLTV